MLGTTDNYQRRVFPFLAIGYRGNAPGSDAETLLETEAGEPLRVCKHVRHDRLSFGFVKYRLNPLR